MNTSLLDIYFTGRLHSGVTPETALERLAALFRTDPARLRHLFDGQPQRLKSGVDRDTANKYLEALKRAGMQVALKPHGSALSTPAQQRAPQLTLAPLGSDLSPDNRQRPAEAADIDISHLRIAGPGAGGSGRNAPGPTPLPDLAHLQLAPAGSDLLDAAERAPRAQPRPVPPLDLAPAGSPLLEDHDEPPPSAAPDISHLRLATPD